MKSRFHLVVAAIFIAFAGMDTVAASPTDITLPSDVSVEPAGPATPQELAWFSGRWYGEWRGERTNVLMAEQMIVVEKIDRLSASVAYVGLGRWGQIDGRRWSYRLGAQFVNGNLVFKLPTGTVVTCQKQQDGSMSARGESSTGTWVSTMKKLPDSK